MKNRFRFTIFAVIGILFSSHSALHSIDTISDQTNQSYQSIIAEPSISKIGHKDPKGVILEKEEPLRHELLLGIGGSSRQPNPTAPNEQTKFLSGDFTDTDGDGMTDAAELKYGFDPKDPQSFPVEPPIVADIIIPITESGIGAWYEPGSHQITIKWKNPDDGSYSLDLYNGSTTLYYGGHYSESAPVNYFAFNLTGTEILTGHFTKYASNGHWVADYPQFMIDLSKIPTPIVGLPSNKISYTFEGFPSDKELVYRNFLKRVLPLMYSYLGPPAETFNIVIKNMGADSDYFMSTDNGRTFLSDTDFIPRLIAHELVHAWKGRYLITSDKSWSYDPALSGFEEATAEGTAFELMHEYVRSYPNDSATIQLLNWRPYQYWSSETTYYDAVRHNRDTGTSNFWDPFGLECDKYSTVATTWQIMMKKNPNLYKEFMEVYYAKINSDPTWRPNREDIIEMWSQLVPYINGIETPQYINSVPVFRGKPYDEGIYVLNVTRPYGSSGDQHLAVTYADKDGDAWWGILKDRIGEYHLPDWINWMDSDPPDNYIYINTQDQPFTVDIYNSLNERINSYNKKTEIQTDYKLGYGWKRVDELNMANFPVGLYGETVSFDNYIGHDLGAREDFYFFGYSGINQNSNDEYVIMIGVDGVASGNIQITINNKEYRQPIISGAAVFRSTEWPFDMEGEFPIIVSSDGGESHTYYRTILEAGTYWSFFQYQFIIIDKDFNGVEDPVQAGNPPPAPGGVTASDNAYSDKVRISWSASPGATGYKIFRNTTNDSSTAVQIGTTTELFFDDTAAAAGITYYYWVKAYNSGGSSTFSNGDSGYVADTAAPSLSIITHTNNQYVSTASITLGGTASDSGKGDNGIEQVTVNGNRASNDTATGSGTANWSKSVSLSAGANSITVIAYDNSSNHNQTSQSITIYYDVPDTTGPSLSITSHNDGQHVSTSSITLSGTASDSGRGDNGIQQVTVNGSRANNDTATGSGTANWSKSVSLSPGANTITVIAYDNSSDHNTTTQSITIYYDVPDTTPPDTSITGGPSGTITYNNPTFTYTGSDYITPTANLIYATYLQGYDSGWSSFSSSTTKSYTNLPNGSYTFQVKAKDQAGNEDSTPATRSFTVTENIYVAHDCGVSGNTPCYPFIQEGIDAANTFTTIMITEETYAENVILDSPRVLILHGGWNPMFTTDLGNTVINGSLTISDGTLILGGGGITLE